MENKASICIRSLKEMEKKPTPKWTKQLPTAPAARGNMSRCGFFPSTSYKQERGFWNSTSEELSQRAVVICLQNVNWANLYTTEFVKNNDLDFFSTLPNIKIVHHHQYNVLMQLNAVDYLFTDGPLPSWPRISTICQLFALVFRLYQCYCHKPCFY